MKKLQDVFHKAMMAEEHIDRLEKAGQPVPSDLLSHFRDHSSSLLGLSPEAFVTALTFS